MYTNIIFTLLVGSESKFTLYLTLFTLKFEDFYDHEYNTLELSTSHVRSIFVVKTDDFYLKLKNFMLEPRVRPLVYHMPYYSRA